jgi:hypothetical protein
MAIVAHDLSFPVILGCPFLVANKIVIDHHLRTVIAKDTGYDLLHPSPIPSEHVLRHSAKLAPLMAARKQRVHDTIVADQRLFRLKLAVVSELEDKLPSQKEWAMRNGRIVGNKRSDILAAMRERIEVLAHRNILLQYNAKMKAEFVDRFPVDILHVDWLPTDVYHRIHLRDQTQTIKAHSYACPKKYCAPWAKMDMTNSFFQTLVHPDDIKYMAMMTPFGLYEWVVMPMGLRNSPATHQRRMNDALRAHIGTICHVYLDNIIIWSQSLAEHEANVRTILQCLRNVHLYASHKETELFLTEVDFLGHRISERGISPDPRKVERIASWPQPMSATEVCGFLGLVRYLALFLPGLADLTLILTTLTTKEAEKSWPGWEELHRQAFVRIKDIVLGVDCLTTIDHNDPGNRKIFVTCDASDRRTGCCVSFGETWESARPVGWDSKQLNSAQCNYPTYEKELLAIVRALEKFRPELLGAAFTVYTDHRTLENFMTQRDLSRRQVRWQEYLAQYDFTIVYIKGEDNTVADALSRLPDDSSEPTEPIGSINAVLCATADPALLIAIKAGYTEDKFAVRLITNTSTIPGVSVVDGLLYVGDRLVIPRNGDLREHLFRLAHDNLGILVLTSPMPSLRIVTTGLA